MRCPACQTESSGSYCPECGTPLKGSCKSCDAPLAPGARFCTQCGTRARASGTNLPWYIAGVALVALIAVVLIPAQKPAAADQSSFSAEAAGGAAPAMGAGAAPAMGGEGTPPPLTGTPREQADRLFNLIMENREKGDTARARFFVPMGLQAYGAAGNLDADGLYHLSLLQAFGGSGQEAVATAQKILATSPDNLLGLVAAAQGSLVAGDKAAAARYYKRFLAVFAAEKDKPLPEYRDHSAALPGYEAEARSFVRQ